MDKPNILMIISHDTGRYIGTYGKNVSTPALDELAKDGIQFNQYFCSQPQCSPSRGSILTGLYSHRHGMMGLAHMGHTMHGNVETLPMKLKKIGYKTSLFGMYHESINGKQDPYELGYDHYQEVPGNLAKDVTKYFVEYLNEQKESQQPFFASVGFEETHRPFPIETSVSVEDVDIPPYLPDTPVVREDLAYFYQSIKDMDKAVEQIIQSLKDNGLYERTIIIYTTDHGIAFPRAKGTLYDSGLETAFIIRFPKGMVKQGYAAEQLICNIDLMPTLLDIVGGNIPENIDGVSFWPLIKGEVVKTRDHFYAQLTWHDRYHPMRAVRTERYKYIKNFIKGPKVYMPYDIHTSLSGQSVKQDYYIENVEEELYDLKVDPHEMNNVIDNPKYADIVDELRKKLKGWMEETNDPLIKGDVPGYEADEWKSVDDDFYSKE